MQYCNLSNFTTSPSAIPYSATVISLASGSGVNITNSLAAMIPADNFAAGIAWSIIDGENVVVGDGASVYSTVCNYQFGVVSAVLGRRPPLRSSVPTPILNAAACTFQVFNGNTVNFQSQNDFVQTESFPSGCVMSLANLGATSGTVVSVVNIQQMAVFLNDNQPAALYTLSNNGNINSSGYFSTIRFSNWTSDVPGQNPPTTANTIRETNFIVDSQGGGQDLTTVITTAATYTVQDIDSVILCNTGASNTIDVTLPTPSLNKGRRLAIKNTGTGTGTVAVSGAVAGDANVALASNQSIFIACDGSNWWIISAYLP